MTLIIPIKSVDSHQIKSKGRQIYPGKLLARGLRVDSYLDGHPRVAEAEDTQHCPSPHIKGVGVYSSEFKVRVLGLGATRYMDRSSGLLCMNFQSVG